MDTVRRFGWLVMVWLCGGCALQSATPLPIPLVKAKPEDDSVKLVKDVARRWGTNWVDVEGVSLCVGLNNTGSDAAPSAERTMLHDEMKIRDVENPDAVLASASSALCLVRAILPPGAQKGDRVDVEVRVPAKSETTSLANGWLMLARLREYARLNNRLSSGHVVAMCQGDILVDAVMQGTDDSVMKTRGTILGGGVVTKSRQMGLRLRGDYLSVKSSALVGKSINERFHIYSKGDKTGVAVPKTDAFIQLVVHPRYRENLTRYMRVIENIPLNESSASLVRRLASLEKQLKTPAQSSMAAVQLEAIGKDAIPTLLNGLQSPNPEVQFYAAEALGYLDQEEAAEVLAASIRHEPAFRWRAFQALLAMDHMASQEQLTMLLDQESAETRYAAFDTLLQLSADDPLVRGENVGGQFSLHFVESAASPLVHVSKDRRPEIVLFGDIPSLESPIMLFAGHNIAIRDSSAGKVCVKRLAAEREDQQRVVSSRLDEVIAAVVEMGGKYSDVVQVISQAKENGCLDCRVAYSARPETGRKYERKADFSIRSFEEDEPIDGPVPPMPGFVDVDEAVILEAESATEVNFDAPKGELPQVDAIQEFDLIGQESPRGSVLFDD